MNRLLPAACILFALVACARGPGPADPAASPLMVLERARARPTPDPIRARVHLKIRSPMLDLQSGTGGVLIVDRPGRGHLAILGPLGGPVATLSTDGEALAVAIPRDQRLLLAPRAEQSVREVTEGMVGLDDLVGLLLGDIPFDEAKVRSRRLLDDGTVEVVLAGPTRTRLVVVLDPELASPVEVELVDKAGRPLLTAAFEPFERRDDGTLVPTRAVLELPSANLTLELRYRSWEVLDEVPAVFETSAPQGWSVEPLATSFLAPLGLSPQPGAHP